MVSTHGLNHGFVSWCGLGVRFQPRYLWPVRPSEFLRPRTKLCAFPPTSGKGMTPKKHEKRFNHRRQMAWLWQFGSGWPMFGNQLESIKVVARMAHFDSTERVTFHMKQGLRKAGTGCLGVCSRKVDLLFSFPLSCMFGPLRPLSQDQKRRSGLAEVSIWPC